MRIAPAPRDGLLIGIAGVAILLAATVAAYRPPAPAAANAPATRFSAARAQGVLQELVGDGTPHPIGSAADSLVRGRIVARLEALGYAPQLETGTACDDEGDCGRPVNIVARLDDGTAAGAGAVLLAAHYDSVPAGPGAADDGAGVAAVLEIARTLKSLPPTRRPIVLLIDDGEEAGLLGAELFVHRHPWAKTVRAAVNLEARGTSGPSLMFETGSANRWLMPLYGRAVRRPMTNSIYYFAYKQLPNDTDFTVFKTVDYQGFNFAFIGDIDHYHTPRDDYAHADARSIQHQGDNALAALLALANGAGSRAQPGDAVFFDGFSRALFSWPAGASLPAAILIMIVLLGECALLLRRRALAPQELLAGLGAALANPAFGTAAAAALLVTLRALGKVPPAAAYSWVADPAPLGAAFAALAALAAGLVGLAASRRAGFWGFWCGGSLVVAAFAIALGAALPAMSFLPLLPAVAAALAAAPAVLALARREEPSAGAKILASVAPLWTFFALLLPLLLFLYPALGAVAWPIGTAVLGLAAVALLPLLALVGRRQRRIFALTAGVAAAGGIAWGLMLPTYTTAWPQRVNVEYWLDAGTGRARWAVRADSGRLPVAFAQAAAFEPLARPLFAGSRARAFFAPAPALALAGPVLETVATSQSDGMTHYRLKIRSPRGASEAVVIFPPQARIDRIDLATESGPLRATLGRLPSGARRLDLYTLPAAGFEFEIQTPLRAPFPVEVFDKTYALPRDGEFLARSRSRDEVGSQDGDLTVVARTVTL